MKVSEHKAVVDYLKKRKLEARYLKAKEYIETGLLSKVDFRKRQPKDKNIWYFRISKKYRAFAELQNDRLIVFHISDHQD